MKKTLFLIDKNRRLAFGDVFGISMACHMYAKTIDDSRAYIQFPSIAYNEAKWTMPDDATRWQKTSFLPWTYVHRDASICVDDWDNIVDTSRFGWLYDIDGKGCPPLFHKGRKVSVNYAYQFFDILYVEKKIFPYIDRWHFGCKPFIIFQYRDSFNRHQQNTVNTEFSHIFELIKDRLGNKYSYWKTGEKSPFDDMFDFVMPSMYEHIDGFAKAISGCSLLVSSHSGPQIFPQHFEGLPCIRMSMNPKRNAMTNAYWKRETAGFGIDNIPFHPMWCRDRLMDLNRNVPIDDDAVTEFLERYGL